MGVGEWFGDFFQNCQIPPEKISSISYRYKRITKQLNIDFYNSTSEVDHSYYVGSYGRDTASNKISDLDIIYVLPYSVYAKYNEYTGNGQSSLLQEVKKSIQKTYSTSDSFGDGQVVGINFDDGIQFEIVPVFINDNGSYTYPDSNGGGCWRTTDPIPEINSVKDINNNTNKNLKKICRMMRHFVKKNDVPMGGMLIDTLAARFIKDWEYSNKSFLYYDWLFRDFFYYLSTQDSTQSTFRSIGSNRGMNRSGVFERKAKTAYENALAAIEHAANGYDYSAKLKWREIFGTAFPQ